MTQFTGEPKALLDLPDDTCRLLVLAGLPAQGDS